MKFTYEAYRNLINTLKEKEYKFCTYENYKSERKAVILRHDIDNSLERALSFAELENKLGVFSYYFLLLNTDFYNINSKKNFKIIEQILKLGGKIGLHFDETKYKILTKKDYIKYINYELKILSSILNQKINVVSMHRPSNQFLEMDLEIPNVINSYQKKFFKEFKYVSDSRMYWRENIEELIESNNYSYFHILTHPFWYSVNEELMEFKLKKFLKESIIERYDTLNLNIRDFHTIISEEILNEYKK